jgi:hypothetical protein
MFQRIEPVKIFDQFLFFFPHYFNNIADGKLIRIVFYRLINLITSRTTSGITSLIPEYTSRQYGNPAPIFRISSKQGTSHSSNRHQQR